MDRRMRKRGYSDTTLIGLPTTIDDLRTLKPFEFQNWVIARINGVQANRKSGDMGIDGWTFMIHDPVQIKQSESVGRNVIDNFETAIKRASKQRGFVVALSFTKGAVEEVARIKKDGLDIQLVNLQELLDEQEKVLGHMGISTGLGGLAEQPLPQFDPTRHTVEELVASGKAAY
jgi:restriction endonuclease Mrr